MTILVVAAHPDDEVLGCGASVAKWADEGKEIHNLIMADGATSRGRHIPAQFFMNTDAKNLELSRLESLTYQAGEILGSVSVKFFRMPDNRMDSLDLLNVIKAVETEIKRLKPQTVLTHHAGDLNIDHQIVHQAVVTACRPEFGKSIRRLLTFEVASSTEWQTPGSNVVFQPNWFEDVTKTIDRKIEALKIYAQEMRQWPHPRSIQNIENLARWRGGSVSLQAAEAFMLLRELR